MSIDHLMFEWWTEDDLGLWVRHNCNGEIKEWHPDSRWQVGPDGPRPSLSCDDCGAHTILQNVDHRDRLRRIYFPSTDYLSTRRADA